MHKVQRIKKQRGQYEKTIVATVIGVLSILVSYQGNAACLAIKNIESSIKTQKVLADLDPNYIRPRMYQRSDYSVTATIQFDGRTDRKVTSEVFHWVGANKSDYNNNLRSLEIQLEYLNSNCTDQDAKNTLVAVLNRAKESGFEESTKFQDKRVLIYHEGVDLSFDPKLLGEGVPLQYTPQILLVK